MATEELWSAMDQYDNSVELDKDDQGIVLGFGSGISYSGYPWIRLDRKQLKDLFNAIGNEIGAFPDLARIEKKGRFEALMEAQEKWRSGDWARAPRRKNPTEERIANGQFVTDWLKERAELELE